MKNSFFYIGGGVAIIIIVAYLIYKNINRNIGETKLFSKKCIDIMSYEYLITETKALLKQLDSTKLDNQMLSMNVIPNKLALQFFEMAKEKQLAEKINFTEEEKAKMVILCINSANNVLIGEVLIADKITEDFYDFVPEDKIYIKKISISK